MYVHKSFVSCEMSLTQDTRYLYNLKTIILLFKYFSMCKFQIFRFVNTFVFKSNGNEI